MTQHYASLFEKNQSLLPGNDLPWLKQLRENAFADFLQKGFPTKQDEDWKYTSLRSFSEIPFELNLRKTIAKEAMIKSMLQQASLQEEKLIQLVFINGEFFPNYSTASTQAQALNTLFNQKKLENFFATNAQNNHHAFTKLNTAFMQNGTFIKVSENQHTTLHLIFLTTPEQHPLATHLRNLIVLEKNATATVIETYIGENDTCYLTNTLTEAVLHENAKLTHCKIQNESKKAFHFGTTCINQVSSHSQFNGHVISLGGLLSRSDTQVILNAPHTHCTLNGLYQLSDEQHMDHYTAINHEKPHSLSREFYKGILDGKSHGVFNGKICVQQDAQKIDSKQYNQNLLLSDEAEIDTKPQLEILADDVKCAHGTTVGQLDEAALFYLQSRGLDKLTAKQILIKAFFNDILENISESFLKEHVQQCL